MSNENIERIIKNTKFTMAMEGLPVAAEEEDAIRKILKGELDKDAYFSSIREQALALDETAERAGGYVAYPNDSTMEADYHAMSDYCRKKGIKPMELTEDEYRMFIFPEYQ